MKYFIDLEFIERGAAHPIDLISVGIVAEDGREYYAISQNFTPRFASDWVVDNVLESLPPMRAGVDATSMKMECDHRWEPEVIGDAPLNCSWKAPLLIAKEIKLFCTDSESSPEFWGEYCATDWVVFYQLWGALVDKPTAFPWRCRDVVQLLEDDLGLSQSDWPVSLETGGNHNALLGAKTVKARYEWCMEQKRRTVARILPPQERSPILLGEAPY